MNSDLALTFLFSNVIMVLLSQDSKIWLSYDFHPLQKQMWPHLAFIYFIFLPFIKLCKVTKTSCSAYLENYLVSSIQSDWCDNVYMRERAENQPQRSHSVGLPHSVCHTNTHTFLCVHTAVVIAQGSNKVKIWYITQWFIDFSTPGRQPVPSAVEGDVGAGGESHSTLCSTKSGFWIHWY